MRRRWRKFRKLSRAERSILLRAFVVLPVLSAGLYLFGFRRLHRWLGGTAAAPGSLRVLAREQVLIRMYVIARTVNLACRISRPRPLCLARSLALWWILRLEGIGCSLRIGVQKGGDSFEAHAWVEGFGLVLNDTQDIERRYSPFAEPIEPGDLKLVG